MMIVNFDNSTILLLSNEISWLILKLTSLFSHLHLLQEFLRRMIIWIRNIVGEDNLVKQVNCEFHTPHH